MDQREAGRPQAVAIQTEVAELAGVRTVLRRRPGDGVPTVFVHGNPTHSADWIPFLEQGTGPALAFDLPNFGQAERLDPARFGASMHDYSEWIGRALDQLCPDALNLVVHDWGGIALHAIEPRAERLRRLVVINAVPLLAGYRWHWVARVWRTRGLGPAFNAVVSRAALGLALRQARPGWKAMPEDFVEMIWSCWDRGTADAVLRLYRSADPPALEAAGSGLDRLRGPALVVWGRSDPYIGERFARGYAERLASARLELIDDAGHWPWIDRPDLIPRISAFLAGGSAV